MSSHQKISVLTFFIILLVLNVVESKACHCSGTATVKGSVVSSDIVFRGIVITKERTADLSKYGVAVSGDTSSFAYQWIRNPVNVVKIKVERLYKGSSRTDTITIITPVNGAGCGFRFTVGQSYIVYGTAKDMVLPGNKVKQWAGNNKTYWTNSCTRTTEWYKPEEEEIIAVLNLPE